jgi:hypothetical protein
VRWISPLCWLVGTLACTQVARAYEDQLTLGLGAGYAHAASDVLPRHGALFEASASVGLDPMWSLRGRGSYAWHPERTGMHVAMLGSDVLYLIDVLEIVPYFGVGAGGMARFWESDSRVDAEVHLVAGLDYLLSRDVALEFEIRPHLLVTDREGDPFYFAAAAAVVFVFDE